MTPGSKEVKPEVAKEGLVKPSSFKRPRLPSGTPPKPAPRPDKKKEPKEEKKAEKPEEKKEEKPEVKKEEKPTIEKEVKQEVKEEEKPEVKEDKPEVKPVEKKEEEPDGKKQKEPEKEEKKEVAEAKEKPTEGKLSVEQVKKEEEEKKTEETEANEKEEKPSKESEEPKEEVKQKLEDVGADTENVDGKVANGETQIKDKDDSETAVAKDDLWVKRDSGKEALRPGGRSLSLKMQRSTSATEKVAPSLRSATLPKPWSPGQAPSSMLSRKLSWELPKVGDEDAAHGVKKERSGSTTEEPIPELSEDQSSKA